MATTTDVPGRYDVALDGTGFMLDWSDGNPGLIHQSLRTQREQSVSQGNIGEATVNPEGFWRRSIDGWHHGAGQTYYDRAESDPLRFRASVGVDVFTTRHQLSLLNDVALAYTYGTGNGYAILAGARLYVRDADVIKFTTAPLTVPWALTTVTGPPTGGGAEYTRGITTDGGTVYIALGTDGIYSSSTTTSTASSFITGTVTKVFYVKGRLLATAANSLYNPVAAGALPTSLLDLNAGYVWVDIAGGPQYIYLLATNGTASVVYKTTIQPDGTALEVPTIAGELPDGQRGNGLYAYAGKVFVSSRTGVQMAEIDGDGNLIFGSRIPVNSTDYGAFEAEDRFVWFPDDPADGTGISRMDLSVETLPNTPAYASDLHAVDPAIVSQTDINAIITYQGKRIYVANTKAWVETDDKVDTGYLDSGLIALDLAEAKTPVSVDVEAALPDDTSIVEALSINRGTSFTSVATFDSDASEEVAVTGIDASRQFEIRTTLATDDPDETPVLYRHTLKVEPNVSQGNYIILRLRLFENEIGVGGQQESRSSVAAARAQLEAWQASRQVIVLQEGSSNYNVTVRDIEWQGEYPAAAPSDGGWQGIMTCRLKVVSNA